MNQAIAMGLCSVARIAPRKRQRLSVRRPAAGKARWNVPKAPTSSARRWRSSRTAGKSRAAPRCDRVGRRGLGGAAGRGRWSCRPGI